MSRIDRDWILISDFGSQTTQLIARRLREMHVYCEIHPYSTPLSHFADHPPKGVILSGGPDSVYDPQAPRPDPELLDSDIPVLGICYGLQSLAHRLLPGSVDRAERREFGRARLLVDHQDGLLDGIESGSVVWMSHGDHIHALPDGVRVLARTENAPVAALRFLDRPVYGVQFHPEVVHSEDGTLLLRNFVLHLCGCAPDWTPSSFIESELERIRNLTGSDRVLCALSGGVDSTVVATLIHKAIGDRLTCVFVNNGLLRKNEYEQVLTTYREHLRLPVTGVDASERFLAVLDGVTDPEEKRKRIGRTFIEVFEQTIQGKDAYRFLAQGTLYPDVIESVSFKGPSATIKSHHNVGGLPERMRLELLEPVRELFKDEVRAVGEELGIPSAFIRRHPFPGPGLGIRIIGEITAERLRMLREADYIYVNALNEHGLYDQVWQAFSVLLPVQSVGVMGDVRTYEFTLALRAVTSMDGMTADWAHLPHEFLAEVSNRIINEVRGINRVVYDISSKPPATIEWE